MSLPPLLALAAGQRARARKPANSEPRPRDGNAEARIQAAIVEWIRTVAPDLICFHIPNGGYRTKSESAKLKWIGALAGVSDLAVIDRDGVCRFLEVKTPGGSLSPEQRRFADRCTAMRIPFAIARSIDDVKQAFEIWEIPTTREPAP